MTIDIQDLSAKQKGVFNFAHHLGNSNLNFAYKLGFDAGEQFVDLEIARFLVLSSLAGRIELQE